MSEDSISNVKPLNFLFITFFVFKPFFLSNLKCCMYASQSLVCKYLLIFLQRENNICEDITFIKWTNRGN